MGDLQRNNLMMLPEELFQSLKSLKYLDLQNNKIEKLPDSMLAMENLTDINLYRNQLSNILVLTKFDKLKKVDISINEILCTCKVIDWTLNFNSKKRIHDEYISGQCKNKHL